MRLIDADKLYEAFEQKKRHFDFGTLSNIKWEISHATTVEAIPVEWIEQYGEANWYDFGTQYNAITKMLEEWERKEE